MKAAEMGYTKSVRILLEHGADVNSKDESGELYTIIVTISIYPPIYISVNIDLCVFNSYKCNLNNKIYY